MLGIKELPDGMPDLTADSLISLVAGLHSATEMSVPQHLPDMIADRQVGNPGMRYAIPNHLKTIDCRLHYNAKYRAKVERTDPNTPARQRPISRNQQLGVIVIQ